MDTRFNLTNYVVRRKVLKLFGGAFHIYGPSGELVMYSRMKAFKLKEDIRLFTGEDMQTELLRIEARQIIDFAACYDVVDAQSGEKVGALRRKGFKSLLRDEWRILDAEGRELGTIQEDSMLLATIRRFLINLIPQRFTAEFQGVPVCRYRQHFNPFVLKISVDFSPDTDGVFDKRLGLAAAVLLCAIEGRQQ